MKPSNTWHRGEQKSTRRKKQGLRLFFRVCVSNFFSSTHIPVEPVKFQLPKKNRKEITLKGNSRLVPKRLRRNSDSNFFSVDVRNAARKFRRIGQIKRNQTKARRLKNEAGDGRGRWRVFLRMHRWRQRAGQKKRFQSTNRMNSRWGYSFTARPTPTLMLEVKWPRELFYPSALILRRSCSKIRLKHEQMSDQQKRNWKFDQK